MKKLSVNLQQDYKTFKAGFECELEAKHNLIIISGVNGSGKSQLGEIICNKSNSFTEVQVNEKPVSNTVYEGIN
jgi:ABC-type Mn2+/Zn2+ transport system ATPase subunit